MRGEPIGIIVAHDKRGADPRFTQEDQRLAETFAARAAVAADLSTRVARDAVARVVDAQELERRRLARELHDETGQALTSMLLALRAVEEAKDEAGAREATARLRELLVETLHDVRRLAVELRPKALDDFGLVPALERLTETFSEQTAIPVELEAVLGEERLPPPIETALYRIVQEALTNVIKHARASPRERARDPQARLGRRGDRGRRRRLLRGRAPRRRPRHRRDAGADRAPRRPPHRRVGGGAGNVDRRRGPAAVIRVVLVDDHAVVRPGLRRVLEAEDDIEVVAEAGSVRDAVFEARAQKPDVIVMDVVMPGASGIEGTPLVLHEAPAAKVLVLSMQDDPRYVREAFAAGASGYVLKEAADTDVVEAVREVADGRRYLHPALGARMIESEAREREEHESDPLSERESEVLRLLALGHTNQEIAKMLYISVRTAESHRAHIMQKLGLGTRAELVRYALAHGLLEDQ